MPLRESQAPPPLAPYAVSKLAAEGYCLVAQHVYGIETVALRYFNVFGDRQDPHAEYAAVIPRFVRIMLEGNRPPIFADGTVSRDFTHVEDVVRANLAAAREPWAAGTVLNVATGRSAINDFVFVINELLSTEIEPVYLDARAGDVTRSLADISRARDVLRYEPAVDLVSGLQRTLTWIATREPAHAAQ